VALVAVAVAVAAMAITPVGGAVAADGATAEGVAAYLGYRMYDVGIDGMNTQDVEFGIISAASAGTSATVFAHTAGPVLSGPAFATASIVAGGVIAA
jgi:hypothetical protein